MWDWSLHAGLLEKDQRPAKLGGRQSAASGLDPIAPITPGRVQCRSNSEAVLSGREPWPSFSESLCWRRPIPDNTREGPGFQTRQLLRPTVQGQDPSWSRLLPADLLSLLCLRLPAKVQLLPADLVCWLLRHLPPFAQQLLAHYFLG